MPFIIYPAHGVRRDGTDLGEDPEGLESESHIALSIGLQMWKILADRNIYTLMMRSDTGSVCVDRYNQIAAMGDLILEIHIHSSVEAVELQDAQGALKPTVLAVCPPNINKDPFFSRNTAYAILNLLEERNPELFVQSERPVRTATSAPCREKATT
jgi:hypothetical protein